MFSLLTVYVYWINSFCRILILTFIALGELEEQAAAESASCFTNLTKKLSFVPLEKELYVYYVILSHSVQFLICCCSQVQKKEGSQNFIVDGYEEVLGLV